MSSFAFLATAELSPNLASTIARYAQSANAIPFAQASYTLRVYDERGIDAAATAGYFNGANSIVNFALYSPAAYTPLASGELQFSFHDDSPESSSLIPISLPSMLAGWTCVTCSFAAVSAKLDHPLLIALPVTVALILIGGAGVFHR